MTSPSSASSAPGCGEMLRRPSRLARTCRCPPRVDGTLRPRHVLGIGFAWLAHGDLHVRPIRPSWRGILFVLVLVAVAAGIAGYLVYREPATYKGRASVFVGQILPADVPDYLLRPVADNYQAALGLPRVTRAPPRKRAARPKARSPVGSRRRGSARPRTSTSPTSPRTPRRSRRCSTPHRVKH
jgi:hypothetical protein